FFIVAALAVNARVGAVISAERVHRMIEEIKCIHAELSFYALCDGDSFDHRQIGIEPCRSAERVITDVAQVPVASIRKRSTQRGQRSEEPHRVSVAIERAWPCVKRT